LTLIEVWVWEDAREWYKALHNEAKQPARKLLTMGWAMVKTAINEVVEWGAFQQNAKFNALSILCMVVNSRACSHDFWHCT